MATRTTVTSSGEDFFRIVQGSLFIPKKDFFCKGRQKKTVFFTFCQIGGGVSANTKNPYQKILRLLSEKLRFFGIIY